MIKALPRTEIETLLSQAQDTGLELTDLSGYCRGLGLCPAELLNALSIEVARRYALDEIPYEAGDNIMNGLFTAILDLGMDEAIPQPAFNIYLAFDEGEHQKLAGSNHTLPSERYARARLVEILRELVEIE